MGLDFIFKMALRWSGCTSLMLSRWLRRSLLSQRWSSCDSQHAHAFSHIRAASHRRVRGGPVGSSHSDKQDSHFLFWVVSGCIRCLLSSLKVSQLFHMKKKQLRYRRQLESKSQQFSISLEEKKSILTLGPVGSSRGSHFLFELFLHCSMSPGKEKADLICWKRQENRSRQHK